MIDDKLLDKKTQEELNKYKSNVYLSNIVNRKNLISNKKIFKVNIKNFLVLNFI